MYKYIPIHKNDTAVDIGVPFTERRRLIRLLDLIILFIYMKTPFLKGKFIQNQEHFLFSNSKT